jgi:hypothetical protein
MSADLESIYSDDQPPEPLDEEGIWAEYHRLYPANPEEREFDTLLQWERRNWPDRRKESDGRQI